MAGGWPKGKESEANLRRYAPPPSRGRREKRDERHLPPSYGRGMPEGQGVGRREKRAKPTSGAARHLLPEEGGRSGESYLPPFPWKGDARRAGGWPKAKRAKLTSGATRHFLPAEGERSGMSSPSPPFPWKGGCPKGGGVAEVERERSQPPALRATSFQRMEREAG